MKGVMKQAACAKMQPFTFEDARAPSITDCSWRLAFSNAAVLLSSWACACVREGCDQDQLDVPSIFCYLRHSKAKGKPWFQIPDAHYFNS